MINMDSNMKYKLSALSLALIPAFANASVEIKASNQDAYKQDSLIVVYKKDATASNRRAVRNLVLAKISDINNDEVDDKYRNILNGRMANYELDKMSVKDALAKVRKDPAVLYAEPDYIVTANVMPDDSSFSDLWGMLNTGQTGGVEDADIDAPEAWDI